MLPSIGLSEMLLLAVLMIIVIGPEDMPKMMKQAGQFIGKIKAMGQDFKDAFDEMGREAEIAELRKEIDDLKSLDRIAELKDIAFDDEMMELDSDIRDSVALEHPRKAATPSDTSSDAPSDTVPQAATDPKAGGGKDG